MKTIITILILLAFAGLYVAVMLSGGSSSIAEVSVFRDITESHLSQPEAAQILPLFNLDQQKWNGGVFRFTDITDVSYMPIKETSIGAANQWLSNEYDRASEIKKFDSDVTKILFDASKDKVGRWLSSVYLPIANELNNLSHSTSKRRVLLVYSDLMENDLNYSFYNNSTLNLLSKNYEIAQNKFDEMMPLENISGIEVYLLYEPPDAVRDVRYKIVSGFYKQYLESKGATVTISASLH